ncbi:beta-propeller domain-containing protein [Bacillus sp. DTU_2020_1000418_1_SI_GHA_SEK_038]|uniref:beta-propeller domain-containing protein n=1 Tax=Bacillus sp. DTU_2020_1000418_1_SI_GHA_SEK_038 TaxID=3077585 RepID=UPI0028E3BF32|nr:beta-propeller domain-containing protein [Bacillus sp. DTU_2020_1000418_1_SI_GHA_SEK_038]WNS73533.1 beta-propeller domain-containing protein [Bacillus sp. DTU_2020_1000418_1_SI_GHA_SEK_038]
MKKKWLAIGGVITVTAVILSFFLITQLKVVSGMDTRNDKTIVLQNKIWKINFSEKLDSKSVNEKSVYVTDDKGELQNVTVNVSKEGNAIIVDPPAGGYSLDAKYYTLHVNSAIKSSFGRKLLSGKNQTFEVKATLPTVNSKSALNELLLKRLKEEEKQHKTGISFSTKEASQESAAADTSGSNYSETNVQVQGIDEADMVKTDGSHIYQVVDGKVQIIKAAPANTMSLESVITFDHSFSPYQVFIYKDQLIIIGHSYGKMAQPSQKEMTEIGIAPIHETTKAIIYNINNKQTPKKIREFEMEGSMLSSRLMNGKVYLVANKYPQLWILKDNPEIDIRPKYSDSLEKSGMKPVDYDHIQYFPDSNESNFTNIAVIDLDKPSEKISVSTYLGSGNNLYMSKNNLYLAVSNYYWFPMNADKSQQPDTTVYKFSIEDMKVEFHSSSEVPGTVLNQFSMDEYKGYFRIATTIGQAWDNNRPSSNNLYILDENLKQVGELEDLARGERIYSARFMNDRIYIVTFRETDPLFVIDGKDPNNPKVLGELKIPGFSNYLHPFDENHLIGFGYDTKVQSGKGSGNQPIILTDGVKISLFDVSDMSNPKVKFTEIIGGRGTYSPLNHDHKALLFHKKKNIFAFPITVYQNKQNSAYESTFEFQGAFVYNIDLKTGFHLQTKLTHQDPQAPYEEWENQINRIIYIGNSLYALSSTKISSYDLNSYKQQGELSLKK